MILSKIGLFLVIFAMLALLTGLVRLGFELCVKRKGRQDAAVASKITALKCFSIGYSLAGLGILLRFLGSYFGL